MVGGVDIALQLRIIFENIMDTNRNDILYWSGRITCRKTHILVIVEVEMDLDSMKNGKATENEETMPNCLSFYKFQKLEHSHNHTYLQAMKISLLTVT